MFLQALWTEALTVFSWMFVEKMALGDGDRVSPGTKDRNAYYLVQRFRFLKLGAPLL